MNNPSPYTYFIARNRLQMCLRLKGHFESIGYENCACILDVGGASKATFAVAKINVQVE